MSAEAIILVAAATIAVIVFMISTRRERYAPPSWLECHAVGPVMGVSLFG